MTQTNLWPYSIVALILAGTLSAACGSSGSDGGTGGSGNNGGAGNASGAGNSGGSGNSGGIMAGNICQRVAEIQCKGEMSCCSNPGRDVATCTTAQKKACADNLGLDALSSDPITAFDVAKATAALDKFQMLASKCDTSITQFALGPDGFRSAAAGTVAAGGTCNPVKGASNKVAALVSALASCKDSSSQACLTSSTTDWKCSPRADSGGHCFTDVNCKDGLFCDNAGVDPDAGKCAARKANGADCMLGDECSSFACSGSKCVDQTKDTAYCLATQ